MISKMVILVFSIYNVDNLVSFAKTIAFYFNVHFIRHILPILVQGKIPLQFSASNQSIHHEVILKGITFEMKLT